MVSAVKQKLVVPPDAAVMFSNGTVVLPSVFRYGRRFHAPLNYAWLLQATRKDGSKYQDYGFARSERNAKEALNAAYRMAKNLLVTFEEMKRISVDASDF